MSQLTNTQRNILTIAASRPDGKLEPLPPTIMGGAKTATLKSLENKGFAEQLNDDWVITTNGRKAISNEPEQNDPPAPSSASETNPAQDQKQEKQPTKKITKKSLMLEMIDRPDGISLKALCIATGWEKHSVRGSISQLKSQGNDIVSFKSENDRFYKIGALDETDSPQANSI
ncbi:MAG: DUF3489 domain-containing protein [Agarilytica sp.]